MTNEEINEVHIAAVLPNNFSNNEEEEEEKGSISYDLSAISKLGFWDIVTSSSK